MTHTLEFESVSFAYSGAELLNLPDIFCPVNSHLLILGASGSGKSTILHLIAGLLRPQSGTIRVNDSDLSALSDKAMDYFRGQHIGIVFQRPYFIASISVQENLLMTQHLAGLPQDKLRIKALLERLDLGHKLNSKPSDLSLGEQQRVTIARALVNRPKLILADEPTSSLDDENCLRVVDLLEEQATIEQASLIIVTHDTRIKNRIPTQVSL